MEKMGMGFLAVLAPMAMIHVPLISYRHIFTYREKMGDVFRNPLTFCCVQVGHTFFCGGPVNRIKLSGRYGVFLCKVLSYILVMVTVFDMFRNIKVQFLMIHPNR